MLFTLLALRHQTWMKLGTIPWPGPQCHTTGHWKRWYWPTRSDTPYARQTQPMRSAVNVRHNRSTALWIKHGTTNHSTALYIKHGTIYHSTALCIKHVTTFITRHCASNKEPLLQHGNVAQDSRGISMSSDTRVLVRRKTFLSRRAVSVSLEGEVG